jgi:transketolase
MRNAFAEELTQLGAADPRVVLLSGDIGNALFDRFKAQAAGRFFNCGVAEANMMSMATGMALCGLRPVVYTIAPFATTRCFEQIRVGACYHRAPVIIVGTGSGLSYASLGPTHHSCEDVAILRALPGMTVLAPADAHELRACLRAALRHDGPVYMRIGKKGEPAVHAGEVDVRIGRAITVRQGSHACVIGTGVMVSVAMNAAEQLAAQGMSVRVESFHTVKPLDTLTLRQLFETYPLVAVVEEHSRIGGLGGAIAEWRAREDAGSGRLLTCGTGDRFLHETGSTGYARRQFGLTAERIAEQVRAHLRGPHVRGAAAVRTPLRIGLDFDNTIVRYDALCHRLALEQGVIPSGLPPTRLAVRDHLRRAGREDVWTAMQGTLYGERMRDAVPAPGVLAFLRWARTHGVRVSIISHRTRHPFLGPAHDLHAAAHRWIADHLIDGDEPLIAPEAVFFEVTRDDKIRRIADVAPDFFMDDLPEVLEAADFPAGTARVLFDPEGHHPPSAGRVSVPAWDALQAYVQQACGTTN